MSDFTMGLLKGLNELDDSNSFQKININDINIVSNVRDEYNDIEELAESIKVHGVQSPIKILKNEKGKYDILFGHRRFLANKKCYEEEQEEKFLFIPAIIESEKTPSEIIELQMIENIDREDLSDLEKAKSIKKYMEITKKNKKETAKRFGKSEKWVRNILISDKIIDKINNELNPLENEKLSKLSASIISETKGLNPTDQKKILDEVADKNINQKDIRNIKKEIKQNATNIDSAITSVKNKKIKNVNTSMNSNKSSIKIIIDGNEYNIKKNNTANLSLLRNFVEENLSEKDLAKVIKTLIEKYNT